MVDHLLFPLVLAVVLGWSADRQAPDGELLWWPPSTWHRPSRRAVLLGIACFALALASSLLPWWVVLPAVVLLLAVAEVRRRRRARA